jgi:dolichyl-phosphate beta-glucosyltransferase
MTDTQPAFDLSIVIPCYDEAARLPRTLEHTIHFLELRPGINEIVVVSDGSKDGTAQIAETIFKSLPETIQGRAIEYTPNAGKGKAVKVGMCAARGNRILFMDADYAVPLEDLKIAESLLNTGYDIAIGSRALEETTIVEHQSFVRERLAKLFGFIQRNYLGLKIKDTQCGFKLFTRTAAHRIFAHVKLTSVIFDGEMLWLAKRMNFRVKEFPVEWTHDPDTRITYNLWRAFKVFLDMLVIPFIHIDRRTWNK